MMRHALIALFLLACDGDPAAQTDASDTTADGDTASEASGPSGQWVGFGDAIQRDAHGGTSARVVSCGDDLFVHYNYNRGYLQTTAYVLVSRAGGAFERVAEMLNAPTFAFGCGPGDVLFAVEEEHTVSGSFPNATHSYRYVARRWDGAAFVELASPYEGRDAWTNMQVVSDGRDVYFAGQTAGGLRVRVLDGDAWAPVVGADPAPGTDLLSAGGPDTWFDDGEVPFVAALQYTNGVGTGRIFSIEGRALTTRYDGPIDLNRDRRYLAHDRKLYAAQVLDGVSRVVAMADGTVVASVTTTFELGAIDRVGDAFVGVVFEPGLPDYVVNDVVRIGVDGAVQHLGRALGPGTDEVWSEFRSQYRVLRFFEHRDQTHALVDWIVAAGGAAWSDLAIVTHVPR